MAVRDSLNRAYYDKDVRPVDIVVEKAVGNRGADELRATTRRTTQWAYHFRFSRGRQLKAGPEMVLPFFASTIIGRLVNYSPFLITVTAVALKEACTSFPSVNDNSSKE